MGSSGSSREQGIGGGVHLGGELAHAGVLGAAVPLEDALQAVRVLHDAVGALDEAGLLRGAVEAVRGLLSAVAELHRAVGHALRGRDQAGALLGAVAGDGGSGLGDAVGEVLDAGGELVGAGDQAGVLGRAVALDARGQLLRAVEDPGLGIRPGHAGLQALDAGGEVLGAGGELVETRREVAAARRRVIGAGGQLVKAVGELSGAVGRLLGAVGEAPDTAGELLGAVRGQGGAVGQLPGPVGEALRAVLELRGALGELVGAVGGIGEAVVEVVEAHVEAIEILLRHLPAGGRGRGVGDRGADQRVDLSARVVGGDLEDRRGGLRGADGGELGGEVLRDHDHGGVGAVREALLRVVGGGQLPVEAGGLRGVGALDGARLGEGAGQQAPEGHRLGLAVGVGDLGALVEVHDGGRHGVEPVHTIAERPQPGADHEQGQQEHHEQGAGVGQAGHAQGPLRERRRWERWTARAERRRGSRRESRSRRSASETSGRWEPTTSVAPLSSRA